VAGRITHLLLGRSMSWIVAHISLLMTVSGVLTLTMIYAAIVPEAALQSSFAETLTGPVASVVVRNWGALIALIGAMLIYGARNPAVRCCLLAGSKR
jgi:cbb3-type cytochrome oxidase subunit 1